MLSPKKRVSVKSTTAIGKAPLLAKRSTKKRTIKVAGVPIIRDNVVPLVVEPETNIPEEVIPSFERMMKNYEEIAKKSKNLTQALTSYATMPNLNREPHNTPIGGCFGGFASHGQARLVQLFVPNAYTSSNNQAEMDKQIELNKPWRERFTQYLFDPVKSPYRNMINFKYRYKGEYIYTPEFVTKYGFINFDNHPTTHLISLGTAMRQPIELKHNAQLWLNLVNAGVSEDIAWAFCWGYAYSWNNPSTIIKSAISHSTGYYWDKYNDWLGLYRNIRDSKLHLRPSNKALIWESCQYSNGSDIDRVFNGHLYPDQDPVGRSYGQFGPQYTRGREKDSFDEYVDKHCAAFTETTDHTSLIPKKVRTHKVEFDLIVKYLNALKEETDRNDASKP